MFIPEPFGYIHDIFSKESSAHVSYFICLIIALFVYFGCCATYYVQLSGMSFDPSELDWSYPFLKDDLMEVIPEVAIIL